MQVDFIIALFALAAQVLGWLTWDRDKPVNFTVLGVICLGGAVVEGVLIRAGWEYWAALAVIVAVVAVAYRWLGSRVVRAEFVGPGLLLLATWFAVPLKPDVGFWPPEVKFWIALAAGAAISTYAALKFFYLSLERKMRRE